MNFTSILRQIIVEESRFEILRNALTKSTQDKEGKKIKPKLSMKEFVDIEIGRAHV